MRQGIVVCCTAALVGLVVVPAAVVAGPQERLQPTPFAEGFVGSGFDAASVVRPGVVRADGTLGWTTYRDPRDSRPSVPAPDPTDPTAAQFVRTTLGVFGENASRFELRSVAAGRATDQRRYSDLQIVPAVDGLEWVASVGNSPTFGLYAIDDRDRVRRAFRLRGVTVRRAIATKRGLRIIGLPKPHSKMSAVMTASGRTLARLPLAGTVEDAAVTPSGALLVVLGDPILGDRRGFKQGGRIVKVTPSGRVSTLPLLRVAGEVVEPLALENTRDGIVVAYHSPGRLFLESGDVSGIGRLRGSRLIDARAANQYGLNLDPQCRSARSRTIAVNALSVAPSGHALATLSCVTDEQGSGDDGVRGQFTVGLDAAMRPRWSHTLPRAVASSVAGPAEVTGPDGRLFGLTGLQYTSEPRPDGGYDYRTTASIGVGEEPGAMSAGRGRITSAELRGRTAHVAIRCTRPWGSVCNGRVSVRAADKTIGSAAYALPGRPFGASITRTIDLEAGVGRRSARLSPVR